MFAKRVIGEWYWPLARQLERVMTADQLSMQPTVLAAMLARLMSQPRFNRLWDMPLLHRPAGRKAMQTPDPDLLEVLAIDRVGPVAVWACASGVEVRVAGPDELAPRCCAWH